MSFFAYLTLSLTALFPYSCWTATGSNSLHQPRGGPDAPMLMDGQQTDSASNFADKPRPGCCVRDRRDRGRIGRIEPLRYLAG